VPHLHYRIKSLQTQFPFFNTSLLSSNEIIKWAQKLNIYALSYVKVPYAQTFIHKSNRIILYNPKLTETELTLALAHDLGHNLLGHIEASQGLCFQNPVNVMFSRNRVEREASIFALLSLLPTHIPIRLALQGRLEPQELYADFRHLWSDLEDEYALALCEERIAMFHDLIAVCGGKCLRGGKCNGCGAAW
jgi:Zn-dependent peptidase ImmA (M78 family)